MRNRIFTWQTIGIVSVFLWLALPTGSRAAVTVVQGVSPGATNWPGSPIIATVANPSGDSTSESFNGAGGCTNLSETFTITTTNYLLQSVYIYASGGSGGNIILNLYDLGSQTAPNPGAYSGGGNLLGSEMGLAATVADQSASIMEFNFSGADQAYLQLGHMYAFEVTGAFDSTPTYWQRSTSDTYAAGAAYRNESWINGTNGRDFAMAVYASPTNETVPAAQCIVDWNTVYQRIDGFGASSAWQTNWTTNQADMFFSTNKGIGLSLLRNHIAPGGTTAETNIMQWAQARGARVWSTPWSPAVQFKTTGNVDTGGFLAGTANYQAYANQLAGYVSSMKNQYGVNLYAISVQNEPDAFVTNYESCNWTAQQIHDFVPYLYSALAATNVASTQIMLPESQNWLDYSNLTVTAMTDTNVAAEVGIVADHNYDGYSGPSTLTRNSYGKALWETEVSLLTGNDSSISNGVYYAQRIYLFMTQAQVNAWHYWWLVPGNSVGNQCLLDIDGSPAKRMYTLGNYSLFVRPNFYRISANVTSGAAQVSAYKDPVAGNFAIVAINGGNTSITQAFTLTNCTALSVTPWITSSNQSLASNPPISLTSSTFTNVLAPMSVTTFAGQNFFITNVSVVPRPSSAIITCTTSLPASSQIAYGTSPAYGSLTPLNTTNLTSHAVMLTGLSPGNTYYFQIISSKAGFSISATGTFSTDISLILQSTQATYAGGWTASSSGADRYSPVYNYANVAPQSALASAMFQPAIVTPGQYDFYLWYSEGTNRSSMAPVTVGYQGGTITTPVNETLPGGDWQLLTSNQTVAAGTNAFVQLGNSTGEINKIVISDAVMLSYTPGQDSPTNGNVPGWWSGFYFGTNSVNGTSIAANGESLFTDYVLGISPADPNTVLNFKIQPTGGSSFTAAFSPWNGGRIYQLQSSANLSAPVWSNVPGTSLAYTNSQGFIHCTNTSAYETFYRLSVQLSP